MNELEECINDLLVGSTRDKDCSQTLSKFRQVLNATTDIYISEFILQTTGYSRLRDQWHVSIRDGLLFVNLGYEF
jgi:hypothetical protein